jgi:hypothetical protein
MNPINNITYTNSSNFLENPAVLCKRPQPHANLAPHALPVLHGRPSFSLISSLSRVLGDLFSLQSDLAYQLRADRTEGVSLFEGARGFSQNVNEAIQMISDYESGARQAQGARSKLPDAIGAYAQEYLMGRLSQAAFSQIASSSGLELSSIGISDIAQKAFNYITAQSGWLAGSSTSALSSSAGSGVINSAGAKTFGAIGAAYSAFNVIQNWGKGSMMAGAINGATAGAYIGSIIPVVGTFIGGCVGAVLGGISGLVKIGKHQDQVARDKVRSLMLENNIIDEDWNLRLANGSSFNIGRDGRNTLQNKDGSLRALYEVDFSNPLTAEVIGMANPLAAILTGGEQKLMNDFAGYFTNAAISNADTLEAAQKNMLQIFKSFNIHPQQVVLTLKSLIDSGKLDEQEALKMRAGFSTLLGAL